jgi:hypothetical protein
MSRRSGQEGTFFIHGIWHCVKVWKDVGNGEPRMRQTIKICRVKGYPDHIKTDSARRLKAKELIVASGVNNLEIVKRIIGEDHATTFREQTKVFLETEVDTRKSRCSSDTGDMGVRVEELDLPDHW